jgi:hypothetical protein
LTALVSGGTSAGTVTVDGTVDVNAYDGIIPQIINGSGYYVDKSNATLTKADAGVAEIDTLCSYLYQNWKIGPTKIWCGYQAFADITNAIVGTTGAPIYLVANEANAKANLIGGYRTASYINKYYNGQQIEIEVHPWMPSATILALSETVPYQNANIPNVLEYEYGYDYTALEYAMTTPKYEFETRTYGALKHYFPAACGVITNVKAGIS